MPGLTIVELKDVKSRKRDSRRTTDEPPLLRTTHREATCVTAEDVGKLRHEKIQPFHDELQYCIHPGQHLVVAVYADACAPSVRGVQAPTL